MGDYRVNVDNREQWRLKWEICQKLSDFDYVKRRLNTYHDTAVQAYIDRAWSWRIVHYLVPHRPQTTRARLWRWVLGG